MKEDISKLAVEPGVNGHANRGPEDIRMFSALVAKLGWVIEAESVTGKSLVSARVEVWRQLRQVADGIPVTKSGGTE